MPARKSCEKPDEIAAERGEVLIDGPDGIVMSMTPEAALETSDRLRERAARARDQRGIVMQPKTADV